MDKAELQRINSCIVRVAEGDADALDEIYTAVGGRLMAVAFSVVKNRAAAEDVLHDGFIAVAKNAKKFTRSDNGYAWLCTVMRNTALNKLKAEKRRSAENIDDMYYLGDNAAEANQTQTSMIVKEALEHLTELQRQLIMMKYFEDLTVRAIAARLALSKSAVARELDKATKTLKEFLKE